MNSNHPLYKVVREMARADDDQVGMSRIAHMLEAAEREGYVLVPLEATAAMQKAIAYGSYSTMSYGGDTNSFEYISEKNAADMWRAMISKRPPPPEPSP